MSVTSKPLFMNSNKTISSASPNRRRFLERLGVLSIIALVAGAGRRPAAGIGATIDCGPGKTKETVKMLTEDGTLVAVDRELIRAGGRKVTDTELKGWIKK